MKVFQIFLLGSVLCGTLASDVYALGEEDRKTIIIGGGHLGLIEAYSEYQTARKNNQQIRIKIFEKNSSIEETTAANIWNSHTLDEIVSVVPRGDELRQKLKIPFNQPGGIRVEDIQGVNDSVCTQRFIDEVMRYAEDEEGHRDRTEALLSLGRAGMALWKQFYESADPELQAIFRESNFNPCCELKEGEEPELHRGYRIDLIYDVPHASERATTMKSTYKELGYTHCQILSPDEVEERDPSLAQFCAMHSVGEKGKRQWKEDSVALWRPGGCLDTQAFLPKLAEYLKRTMGTYVSKNGKTKDRFQLKFNKKVTGVTYGEQGDGRVEIKGLKFEDGTQTRDKQSPSNMSYVFCPGEAVGTLDKLGFREPAYAGFAGASLSLNVPVSAEQLKAFEGFSHCMEVHKVGVVLAWQARVRNGKIFLGGAGTKAYYGDKVPTTHDKFARDRNLLQLQMFNDVLPQVVSLALERDTRGQTLTEQDMAILEAKGIGKRWVGRRAVAYDGFPTWGRLYHEDELVPNGRGTTHLGSGGGSFSLITSLISRYALDPEAVRTDLESLGLTPEFMEKIMSYADSRRTTKN